MRDNLSASQNTIRRYCRERMHHICNLLCIPVGYAHSSYTEKIELVNVKRVYTHSRSWRTSLFTCPMKVSCYPEILIPPIKNWTSEKQWNKKAKTTLRLPVFPSLGSKPMPGIRCPRSLNASTVGIFFAPRGPATREFKFHRA